MRSDILEGVPKLEVGHVLAVLLKDKSEVFHVMACHESRVGLVEDHVINFIEILVISCFVDGSGLSHDKGRAT